MALVSDPSDSGARLNLGFAYYKSGDIHHATEQFEKVRAMEAPDSEQSVRSAMLLADCYVRLGEDKKVIALLDPLVEMRPDDVAAAYLLGTALLRENEEERGIHILELIMSRSDTAEARLLRATTKMRAADYHGALTDILRCLELKPGLAEAHVVHGRILALNADLAGAGVAFRRALAADPNSFDALLELGTLDRKCGRLAEARATFNRALAIRPRDIFTRFQLALTDSASDHDARAAELLESVVRDAPNYMEAHASLSTVYFRLRRDVEGRREKQIAGQLQAEQQKSALDKAQNLR